MLSSICSILFEKPCENTKTRSPRALTLGLLFSNKDFVKYSIEPSYTLRITSPQDIQKPYEIVILM